MACITCPIRESSPVYQSRKGRSPCTIGPVLKQDSDSFPTPSLSRTPSRQRHVSRTIPIKPPTSPPSSDTPYDSSDDDIIGPITPPAILHHLSNYAKSAKKRPKPYQRSVPNVIERLCGEECSGCTRPKDLPSDQRESTRLQRRLKNLTPVALAHAVIAIQADIEWRRVRAIAAALHVDAVQKHSMFLDVTAKSEAETYVNAVSEPFEAACESLASRTTDELNDRRNCTIAAYELDEMSFTAADTEFDHFENIALTVLDSDGSTTSSDEELFDDN
ncbi:hypothetical protein C8R48DRAFT_677243 [Suillus tomentosus]|nr:hypothetical protein C8R48DRAFT_677243 [Suillus tomentosus]